MLRGSAWVLVLLVLSPAAAPWLAPAAAQGNSPAPTPPPPAAPPTGAPVATPFDPLPRELLDLGFAWLDATNASIAAFSAARPGDNLTLLQLRILRDGAWDYLNESRLSLAESQLLQVDLILGFQEFWPTIAADEAGRRGAALAKVGEQLNRSQAAVDAFHARLRAFDAGMRTTHGLEYATLAAMTMVVGDTWVRNGGNETQRLREAPAAEERIVREALGLTGAPLTFLRFAGDILGLAERVDADAARPRLPANASGTLGARIQQRLQFDQDAASVTGPASADAQALLNEAAASGVASLHLARFASFERARAFDALVFRRDQGTLSDLVLSSNLRSITDNASWLPRADGFLDRHEGPPLADQLRAGGYAAVLQADARNQAIYRLTWDSPDGVVRFEGARSAWGDAVAARYAGETLREVPSSRGTSSGGGDLLLYGGIAVVAAVAVIAVAMLRRP